MDEAFTPVEVGDLRQAHALLENPSFMVKLSNVLGAPLDKGFAFLPANWSRRINQAAGAALFKALEVAIASTGQKKGGAVSNRWHKILAGASGGVGGAFGFAALPVELPISTTLMLRSIVQIARSEGHDTHALDTKLACLEVFALGGSRKASDRPETAYWVTRMALMQTVNEAVSYLAQKGVVERSAPALVRLVAALASRFGIVISEEVAAKALPVIGAVGGGVINVVFMNHFQQMARGHFIVLRLEKKYGLRIVKAQYEALGG